MTARVIDPVCGMEVDKDTAAGQTRFEGKDYFFCADSCKQRFEAAPERFLGAGPELVMPAGNLITLTPSRPAVKAASAAVVEGERVDLPITGMTCASCAVHIEQSLSKAPGVLSASVNFATNRATVEYDPASTTTGKLIEAVKQSGYDVSAEASQEAAHEAEYSSLRRRFIRRARLLRWSATGSKTRPRSRRQISASPSARGPTLP